MASAQESHRIGIADMTSLACVADQDHGQFRKAPTSISHISSNEEQFRMGRGLRRTCVRGWSRCLREGGTVKMSGADLLEILFENNEINELGCQRWPAHGRTYCWRRSFRNGLAWRRPSFDVVTGRVATCLSQTLVDIVCLGRRPLIGEFDRMCHATRPFVRSLIGFARA